jgi:hypothetical protein
MSPDKTYVIDLESKDFDAYLRILDSAGKQLASDDDGGDGRNARLRFTPPKEGNYQGEITLSSQGALLCEHVFQESNIECCLVTFGSYAPLARMLFQQP